MKLFCTRDINIVHECQLMFNFKLPSEQLERKKTFRPMLWTAHVMTNVWYVYVLFYLFVRLFSCVSCLYILSTAVIRWIKDVCIKCRQVYLLMGRDDRQSVGASAGRGGVVINRSSVVARWRSKLARKLPQFAADERLIRAGSDVNNMAACWPRTASHQFMQHVPYDK